jgi:HJR/Mrr/RecB family endonuclease
MTSNRLTKRQREEKIDELMLLHEALPDWTAEEVVRFAVANEDPPLQLNEPSFTDSGYSESEYYLDRRNRRNTEQRLGGLSWACAIGFGIAGGSASFLVDELATSAFTLVVAGLIVGGIVGSVLKKLYLRRISQTKFARLICFETELFAYVYWAKRRASQFWRSLSGLAFERELAKVFRVIGYEATVTHASGDKGVDIILKKNGTTGIVQCKARRGAVGPNVVRELLGSSVDFKADFAMLASVSGFTPAAIEFANEKSILLLEISDIIRMQDLGLTNTLTVGDPRDNSAGQRVLYFPTEFPFGEIYLRGCDGYNELTFSAVAQGRVTVPLQAAVHLRVVPHDSDAELLPDFSPLSDLGSDDLQELDLSLVFLEDSLLENLTHLTGLQSVRINGTGLTTEHSNTLAACPPCDRWSSTLANLLAQVSRTWGVLGAFRSSS